MEVRNRFKGLDLIDRVSDELWMEARDIVLEARDIVLEARDIVLEAVIKTIPKKKKRKKAKWLSEEALQTAVERSQGKRRKGKIYPFECTVPKNSKER